MPLRLVVYRKICNIKILALVSAVLQWKTDKTNFGPEIGFLSFDDTHATGEENERFDKCRVETAIQQFKSKHHRNTTEMVLFL